jgi:tubulin--tyrosine ligase
MTDLSALAPPPPRARTTEDAPLPLRSVGNSYGFDPEAYDAAQSNAGAGAACGATNQAAAPVQRAGAWTVAALNFNAKREPFSPFDEDKDGKLGSVYTRVTETLLARGDWDRRPALRNKATGELKLPANYALLLGTAQGKGVPWGRLGYGVWPPPLVNYCRGFDMLTRKGKLVGTLEQAREAAEGGWPEGMPEALKKEECVHGDDIWELAPVAFVFHPSKGDANPRAALRSAYAKRAEQAAAKGAATEQTNRWILKPSEGAKGEGIFIESTLEAIEDHLDKQEVRASEGESVSSWVVQAYVHNPLLLSAGNRKFDMRCWVLVDANYGVHLYRHGVLRVASAAYNPDDVNDRFCHLTNHCIATEHAEYGKFEATNELFYRAFDAELAERYPEHASKAAGVPLFGKCADTADADDTDGVSAWKPGSVLESVVLPQIRRQIVQTMLAARDRLEADGEYYRPFQLYGYDFLLDDELRVWLCEVNASPAVADELLPGLADALIRTSIDPSFEPNTELLKDGAEAYKAKQAGAESPSRRECFECIFEGKAPSPTE